MTRPLSFLDIRSESHSWAFLRRGRPSVGPGQGKQSVAIDKEVKSVDAARRSVGPGRAMLWRAPAVSPPG